MKLETTIVVLVGFMGAGKTSVGQHLARRLGWEFVDLDDRIAARAGRSIEEIFGTHGEAAFRGMETKALKALLAEMAPRCIVALGGGAFAQAENRKLLRDHRVVFLDAPAEELFQRSAISEVARPLRQDLNQFRQLYEARRGAYMEAGIRVDTQDKTVAQVAAEVAARLGLDGQQNEASH